MGELDGGQCVHSFLQHCTFRFDVVGVGKVCCTTNLRLTACLNSHPLVTKSVARGASVRNERTEVQACQVLLSTMRAPSVIPRVFNVNSSQCQCRDGIMPMCEVC